MQASRNLEPDGRPVSLSKVKDTDPRQPEAEESYIRIRRSDLERVLALVERLERRLN